MGRAFKVPRKADTEQWAKVQALWLAGFGSSTRPVPEERLTHFQNVCAKSKILFAGTRITPSASRVNVCFPPKADTNAYVCFRPIADIKHIADAAKMNDYFRQTYVLEKVSHSRAIRYVCYEDIRTGKFCVASGEVLFAPESVETLSFHAINQSEQFIRDALGKWFDTLLEAVEEFAPVMHHERDG